MHSLRLVSFLPALALALAGAVPAGEAGSEEAPRLVQTGPVTGDPEKDTIAFEFAAPSGCSGLVPRFSAQPAQIGPATGDPEKDSFGFMVTGFEECSTLASQR